MSGKIEKSFHKFIIIWVGELISSIGSGLSAFALGVYVFHITQTASSVALVTLCAFLPTVLLSPAGGVLADRFDRRRMMILGDSCSAIGLILLLVIASTGKMGLWQICLCITLSSIFTALMEPAYKATVTDLLTEEEFAKASGLVQVAGSAKYLISPVLAGFLLSITSVNTILMIDISTFVVTVVTTLFVKRTIHPVQKDRTDLKLFGELKEGWKVIVKERGIFLLVLLMSVVTFNIGFLQTLFCPLVLPLSDSKTLGTIVSVSAVGMLAGSLVIGIFNISKNYTRVLSAGLAASGIFFSLMGITTHLYFIAGSGILFFASLPFINTSADVMIRKNIANEVQGRAWGIIGILSQLGYVAAYAISGVLADQVFNPLLQENGPLAPSVGKLIGTGEGRGIGLLFLITGAFMVVLAVIIAQTKSIRELERKSITGNKPVIKQQTKRDMVIFDKVSKGRSRNVYKNFKKRFSA